MSDHRSLKNLERYVGDQLEIDRKCHTKDPSTPVQPGEKGAARVPCTACQNKLKRNAQSDIAQTPTIRQIQRILVAVDHEQHLALSSALMLAGPLHAKVGAIYVLEPLSGAAAAGAYDYPAMMAQRRANAQELVKTIEQEIPNQMRVPMSVREGPAAHEIISAAREWPADLIVMGTHRRGPVARLFLGSTSQAVLHQAPCPVLLVADIPATVEQSCASSHECPNA